MKTQLFINGQWQSPVRGGSFEVINPATGCKWCKCTAGVKSAKSKDASDGRIQWLCRLRRKGRGLDQSSAGPDHPSLPHCGDRQ